MFTTADHEFMGQALELAAHGLYTTTPNPHVGCVIVRDGAVVGTAIIFTLTLMATWLSAYIRQARHFEDHPRDLWLLPAFTLLNTFMLMPIRIWGFMRMARNDGWGTRANAFNGDEVKTRRRNPWGAIPYLLASVLVFAGVAYHG